MALSQIVGIPDPELNATLIPANDNYPLTSQSIESLEAGSVLARRDCIKPGKRNQIGLIVTTAVLCIAGFATFVVLLVK